MQKNRRKPQQKAEYRPLTQEELLAEAAQTELENTASVQALIAAEEEVKARAAVRKAKYSGPLLRYHSFKAGSESVVRHPCDPTPTGEACREDMMVLCKLRQ
jgi:vacuolar protein sorting-associated protein 72